MVHLTVLVLGDRHHLFWKIKAEILPLIKKLIDIVNVFGKRKYINYFELIRCAHLIGCIVWRGIFILEALYLKVKSDPEC